MKILFDHQTFDLQNFGGISRYFYELIAEFDKDEHIDWELSIRYSNNLYLKNLSFFNDRLLPKIDRAEALKKFLWGKAFRGKERLYNIQAKFAPQNVTDHSGQNKLLSIEKLKEGNFDIFHPTYYDDYFIDYIGSKPYVLTVYDLIHQIFPEYFLYDAKDKNKNLFDKASKIIAISENTKADLVNIFDVEESKVVVTHLANSLQKSPGIDNGKFKTKLPEKYLLYNGNRDLYKNFLFFSQVFAVISRKEKDLQVVCTGPPFNNDELYFFKKLGIENCMHHAYINDVELACLYDNALAFIFPTMYEGFGLPVLEAFNLGCPVLVSNTSSIKEIGGDAVIYFEPKNAVSIITAVQKVLHDPELRKDLIDKGYEQVKKFSWEKTASETKKVYQQVVGSGVVLN